MCERDIILRYENRMRSCVKHTDKNANPNPTPHIIIIILLFIIMTLSTYHFCHSITNSHFSHNTTQHNSTMKSLQSLKSRAPRPNAILLKFNIYLFVCPLLFKYVKPTHHFSLPPQDKYCSSQYNPFLSPIVKKSVCFFSCSWTWEIDFSPLSLL